MEEFTQNGDFENWIRQDWLALRERIIESNPELVFKEETHLLGRMVTQKRELGVTSTERIIHLHVWKPEEPESAAT